MQVSITLKNKDGDIMATYEAGNSELPSDFATQSGMLIILKSQILNRRIPHELFPKKAVPHRIPAGLDIFRKFILAWGF